VRRLDGAEGSAPEGSHVPEERVRAGYWQIEYHGPDISVTHQDFPEQKLFLDGDGFSLSAPASDIARMFNILPPVIQVHRKLLKLLEHASPKKPHHTHTHSSPTSSILIFQEAQTQPSTHTLH
jgi:hypothetical protein